MPTNVSRPGQPHGGFEPRSPGREHNPLVNHELTGIVRWLDVELERIVLAVHDTGRHAGLFRGRNVTVDLTAARVDGGYLDELVPGTPIRVRARLRRELGAGAPDPLPATSVAVLA